MISYTSGSFEFEDGVLPKGAVDLKLSTEKLLLAAVRRVADRGFVLRHLEGLDVVLGSHPELAEQLAELRPEAADLPERLDGQRNAEGGGRPHPPRRVRGGQGGVRPAVPRARREGAAAAWRGGG